MTIEQALGAAFFFFLCWLSVSLFGFSVSVDLDYRCANGTLTTAVLTNKYELRREAPTFIRVWSLDGEREMFVHKRSVGICEKML